MKNLIKVEFMRQNQDANAKDPYISLAIAYFPSYAKASQYLFRLGFIFETWKYEDDELKFRNTDTQEIALLTPMED